MRMLMVNSAGTFLYQRGICFCQLWIGERRGKRAYYYATVPMGDVDLFGVAVEVYCAVHCCVAGS